MAGQSTTSDEQLLTACLHGEAAGWEGLLDRYAALIYSVPLKYGLTQADAADVFQSVCIILLEHVASIREPGSLAAWLIRTASRESLALIRRLQRDQSHSASEDAGSVLDPDELPEDELLALERQRVVRLAVSQLSAPCRQLVEALFTDTAEQATYQQLAAGLGVPMNSLGPRRARCLERLRRALLAAGYIP